MAFAWNVDQGAMDPERPRSFAGCQVLGELGRGAMGVVYRAQDPELGRQVAIKVLLGTSPSAKAQERFEREAQLTARLEDPGIVRVHRAGVEGRTPYIVYELVEGARGLADVQRKLTAELDRREVRRTVRLTVTV